MQETSTSKIIIAAVFILCIIGIVIYFQAGKSSSIPNLNSSNNAAIPAKYNFTGSQSPTFSFPNVAYASDLKNKTQIINANGQKVEANLEINKAGNGSQVSLNTANSIRPGRYTLVIDENGKKITQDFTWGVLAINPHKSIYLPGETAALDLAVLDEKGKMVCDADVNLTITDPSGKAFTASVKQGQIKVNPECYQKKFTLNPDYETNFKLVAGVGKYKMDLTAITKNGTYSITDFLYVQDNVDFDIERQTATRIFPYSSYPVLLTIKANKDFKGQIIETVPYSFKITSSDNGEKYDKTQISGKNQNIIWNVNIKSGQTINIAYTFKAPEISPQFYLIGPLRFLNGTLEVFKEARSWQLAIDDIGYLSVVISSGPSAYFPFSESAYPWVDVISGTLQTDFHNTGESHSTPGPLAANDVGYLNFNTVGYVEITDDTALDLGDGPFTVEFWLKRARSGVVEYVMEKGRFGVEHSYGVVIRSDNTVTFVDSFTDNTIVGTPAVADTSWHYFVFTKNGSTSKAYLDGVDVSIAGTNATLADNAQELFLGRESDGTTQYQGGIAHLATYKSVLSPTDVLNHYNAALGTLGSTTLCAQGYNQVQNKSGTASSSTTISITLDSTPTNGNVILLSASHNSSFITSVSQTNVNWSLVTRSGTHVSSEIWIGYVGASAGTSITITMGSGNGAAIAEEWSGILSADAIDQTNSNTGISTTISTNSVTPSTDGALVFAGGAASQSFTGGPTGGFTADSLSPAGSSTRVGTAYLKQTTAASASTTWTIGVSDGWDGTIASFLPELVTCTGDFLFQGVKMQGLQIN